MHPTKFDHGRILAQTPFPGIPFPQTSTTSQLGSFLAPLGAELLQTAIRERRFIGLEHDIRLDAAAIDEMTEGRGIARAPKITSEDRRIDWGRMTASEILTRDRVLGRLWDDTSYAAFMGGEQKKRITYESFTRISAYESTARHQIGLGQYVAVPTQKMEDGREAIVVGKPAEISKEDDTGDVDGEGKKSIYSTDFTVEGKGKGAGGLSFAEILRQRGVGG
jgi:methionyl-tRNA formyltransferase